MEKVNYIKLLTILITTLELAIGIFLSFALAKKNTLPIRRAAEKLKGKVGSSVSWVRNELSFIEEATYAAVSENEKIKQEIQQQPAMRAGIMTRLLKGNINDTERTKG